MSFQQSTPLSFSSSSSSSPAAAVAAAASSWDVDDDDVLASAVDRMALEDIDSVALHIQRLGERQREEAADVASPGASSSPIYDRRLRGNNNGGGADGDGERRLKKKHHHHHHSTVITLTPAEEQMLQAMEEERRQSTEAARTKEEHKRHKHYLSVYRDPGVRPDTVHGMMIDAGSTGSRMHVYEFEPRVLSSSDEIDRAVSGKKLSYPGTNTRWTERLRPGLDYFASIQNDDDLRDAVADYLSPLVEFAKTVTRTKSDSWGEFPIFLKATAGMRALPSDQRTRVINTVRSLFSNSTYSPFSFENYERARVISGEEEAIYGWTGVNFVLGTLIKDSEGSGTVVEPRKTYGALDMGGGSTQISFFEPNGDIMSNLFKLQIGAAKHWNVYAHSYLYFGINEAYNRMGARASFDAGASGALLFDGGVPPAAVIGGGDDTAGDDADGVTAAPAPPVVENPCLPQGSVVRFTSRIRLTQDGAGNMVETWPVDEHGDGESTGDDDDDGSYTTIIRNDAGGDFDRCAAIAKSLLRKDANSFCDFAHDGHCSFAGVYQPPLPAQSTEHVGEFLAFSNYYHVWDFLQLEARSSLTQLRDRAREVCAMTLPELERYNNETDRGVESYDLPKMCFRSSYVFEILRDGYGFGMDDHVTATKIVNGHKVGWALGSMLYEINTLPWRYKRVKVAETDGGGGVDSTTTGWSKQFAGVALITAAAIAAFFYFRRRGGNNYGRREYLKEYSMVGGEDLGATPPESDDEQQQPSSSSKKVVVKEYGAINNDNLQDKLRGVQRGRPVEE